MGKLHKNILPFVSCYNRWYHRQTNGQTNVLNLKGSALVLIASHLYLLWVVVNADATVTRIARRPIITIPVDAPSKTRTALSP